jgi:hypothetical protein
MNDDFLRKLAQAQGAAQPPVAERSTTGVSRRQKKGPQQFQFGGTTVRQQAGPLSPSEMEALRRAEEENLPLPRRIETISADSVDKGIQGRYRNDQGGILQLATSRGVEPDTFATRRRNLPYMYGQTPVEQDPSSALAGGRPQGVHTLTHEIAHHLQASTKSSARPSPLAESDGVFVPPYKQHGITVGAGEAEADIMSGALRRLLFGQSGDEGLPSRIGTIQRPGRENSGYSYNSEPTEQLLGQYTRFLSNVNQ